jgi:hypothetical protein
MLSFSGSLPSKAFAQLNNQTNQLADDILKQLIQIDTTDADGNITAASDAIARRLLDAGFPKELKRYHRDRNSLPRHLPQKEVGRPFD